MADDVEKWYGTSNYDGGKKKKTITCRKTQISSWFDEK